MDKFGPNNHSVNTRRRNTTLTPNIAPVATGRNGCRCGNCATRNVNRIPLLSHVNTPFRIFNIPPQNIVPVTNPNVPNSNLRSRVRGGARTVRRVETKVIRRSCNLCNRVTLPVLNNTTVYFCLSATEFSLRCYCICACISLIVLLIILCIANYVW